MRRAKRSELRAPAIRSVGQGVPPAIATHPQTHGREYSRCEELLAAQESVPANGRSSTLKE